MHQTVSLDAEKELLRVGAFQCQRHAAGRLVEPDSATATLIYVRSGWVLATVVDTAGRETLCLLRGPGSLLGLESLRGAPIPYLIWPVTEVVLCTAPASTLASWAASRPEVTLLLDKAIDAATRCLDERMALTGSANARLARFLSSAAGILSSKVGVGSQGLPRHVLARVLAMRPETLSRALRSLAKAGAIELEPHLRILDAAALLTIADGG